MQDLAYLAPTTLEDAVAALGRPGTRALAGGTDLIPQMRERRREVATVVDLKRITALSGIEPTADGGLRIGAAASCTSVARHDRIIADWPGLGTAAGLVGSLQIQSRASLGGNVCNASPSADTTPILLALGATAEIAGPGGRRQCRLDALITGPGRTTLGPGELLAALVLPAKPADSAAAYLRFTPRREMDIAIAGVAASLVLAGDGRIAAAHIVLAAVGPTALSADVAATGLVGQPLAAGSFIAAGKAAAAAARPIDDTRGSAAYRRTLVGVLTARALAECARQLGTEVEVP